MVHPDKLHARIKPLCEVHRGQRADVGPASTSRSKVASSPAIVNVRRKRLKIRPDAVPVLYAQEPHIDVVHRRPFAGEGVECYLAAEHVPSSEKNQDSVAAEKLP